MFIDEAIGPFKIERELGSGAMGTVYRAIFHRDDGKEKIVALKIVALGLLGNEGAMARFDRESSILKQLRHPNIVRLFATGRYKKTPFIAMEFVDGEPLDRVIARRGRLGWEEVVGYMKQLCSALQYAHEKGIIHRDLKPSNLMIMEDGTLKLTDFGIAKDQDVTALTGANSTIGTAAYMSPEQCKGDRNLSGKSDLYSLGVVMFELITGKKPFQAETTVDMFLQHVNNKPPRPSRMVQDLPIWLETLMLHLLEKEKDKRPLDAATVRRALEEIEEKVAAQESAGAAAANARRIDRPLNDAAMDETDREAARTLRDAKKSKRRKKKEMGRRLAWLKFVPPAAGIIAIAAVFYFVFLKPESAEKAYAKVAAAKTPEEKIEKATAFLSVYGKAGGEQVDLAKALLKEARGKRIDGVLEVRFRTKRIRNAQENEDEPCFSNSWIALEAEQKGDLPRAAEFWKKVQARGPEAKDDYGEGWSWLAERHLADIKAVEDNLAAIQKDLKDRQIYEIAWTYEPGDAKSVATLAIRLGGAGGTPPILDKGGVPCVKDDGKVARAWGDLFELTKEKPAQRPWYLLAAREKRNYSELKPETALVNRQQALPRQLELIRQEWAKVADVEGQDVARRECRNRCRDLVELYGDETDVVCKNAVTEANKLLGVMSAKKKAGG